MGNRYWILRWAYLLALSCPLIRDVAAEDEWHRHDPDLWHFATRPDLKPPRWEVKVYDSDKLSDGCWFLGATAGLEHDIGMGRAWLGPTIFDSNGELVWSGAGQLDTPNTMEFRQSYVEGEQRITMLDRDRHTGTIIDRDYEIYKIFYVGSPKQGEGDSINGHELNFVEDGKTVIYMRNRNEDAPDLDKTALGLGKDAKCHANFNGFTELDVKTGETVFDWSAFERIHLNESTVPGTNEEHCNTFDFMHANSVDKLPDGDYILSARHCDTIYKVSHVDGSIVWRLGGKQSDFKIGEGVEFSCQHNVRARGQNETHTLISILDNAKGESGQIPSHDFSRGLLIALRTDTTPMTASLVAHYDHPRAGYAQRRGNLQVLDNGNIFMGWSERALISEHSPDGALLMEAQFVAGWIGAYRSYKFPFVGRPITNPDVKALAYMKNERWEDDPKTKVWVSWNGDTEVKTWKLYGSKSEKEDLPEVESKDRQGFETSFDHDTYYKWISIEGLDKDGKVIGSTGTIKVEQHPTPPEGVEEKESGEATFVICTKEKKSKIEDPAFIFLLSFSCAAGAFFLTWFGVLPLIRSKKTPWSKSLLPRGNTHQREAAEYKMVNADDFDLDDDDGDESDQKLPLTENSSSSHLPRSPS